MKAQSLPEVLTNPERKLARPLKLAESWRRRGFQSDQRMRGVEDISYSFEGFVLDSRLRELSRDGMRVDLRPKSFDVLACLAANAGQLVGKNDLMQAVWPDVVVTDDSLTRCISDIRAALDDRAQRIVKTLPRRGYLLVASAAGAEASLPSEFGGPVSPDRHAPGLGPDGQTERRDTASGAERSAKPTVAVLPFSVIGGEVAHDYFADGIAEELITSLSAFQWLSVICRNSSFTFRDRATDAREISRALGARYLVEGSVRKNGTRVRIAAQLIDADNGVNLWAARYDRNLDDVFDVQDEVTRELVRNLGPEITASEITRNNQRHPSSLSAWDAYLRALPLLREHSKASNAAAESLLRQATSLAPEFSAAIARLSACRLQAAYYSWGAPGRESIAEAWELAQKSRALNTNEPLAYDALASVHQVRGDLAQAIAAARTALQLSSTCTAAYGTLITALAMNGDAEDALVAFADSERTNPRDPDRSGRLMGLACAYFILSRYDDAITTAKEYVALRPNWYGAFVVLAAACALTGRPDEAQPAARRLLELIPHFTITRARQRSLFTRPEHTARILDGLTRAGIPP